MIATFFGTCKEATVSSRTTWSWKACADGAYTRQPVVTRMRWNFIICMLADINLKTMRSWEVVTVLVVVVQAGDFSMHMMTPSICLRNDSKKIAFLNQNNTTISIGLNGEV